MCFLSASNGSGVKDVGMEIILVSTWAISFVQRLTVALPYSILEYINRSSSTLRALFCQIILTMDIFGIILPTSVQM